jgi:hypothetical protein
MNYKTIYITLMDRAKYRTITGYREKHHIQPKCMGGNDDPENIVSLTAEEHYLAHLLLVKIYPENNKLIFAAKMMTVSSSGHIRSNKLYGWLRRKAAIASSESQKGKSYGNKFKKGQIGWSRGKKLGSYSDERKNNMKKPKTTTINMKKPKSTTINMKKPKSDDHKNSISAAKSKKYYILFDINGVSSIFENIKQACIFCGLSKSALTKLANGTYYTDTCKGWKCVSVLKCDTSELNYDTKGIL